MIDSGIVQASLLKPGVVGVGLVSPYSRYFRTNDDLSYISIPEITFSGDYSIEFDAYANDALRATGNSSSFTSRVSVSSAGSINFRSSGDAGDAGINSPDGAFLFGQFNKVVVYRTGSTASISVNGSVVASGSAPSTAAVVNSMFNQGGLISGGILANVRMYDNGTLVRNYPINDNSNIIANTAASLGSELIVNSNWTDGSTGSGTASIDSEGVFTITRVDAGNVGRLDQVITTVIGQQYRFVVTKTSSDNFAMRVGTSLGLGDVVDINLSGSAPQNNEVIFTATSTTSYINLRSTQNNGTSTGSMLSIKEAPGYGSVVNGNASDWGLFNQLANGNWQGKNLSVPPWDSVDQILEVA